jgi:parallel beta-helix repeat protein
VVKLNQTPVLFLRTLKHHALRVFVVLALVALATPLYTYTRGYLHLAHVEAAAGINRQISFQGKLVNPDGTNVTDGSYSIVFSIYTVASAGTNIWTETQSVTLSNGIFQVNLGSVTALPGSVDFNTDNIYLGIKVGADAEMTPRVQFTAVPQAFNAEKLGGLDKTGFIQNTTSMQSSANLYIQSGAVGNVTAKLRAFTGQTADILQVRNSGDTATVFAINPSGTITAGTWQGATIGVAYGGTGATTLTSNGVLYGNGTGAVQATAAGTTGQCLTANTGAAPSWGSCGGASLFTDGGTYTYLNSVTDDFVLGATSVAGASLFFDTSAANLYLGTSGSLNGTVSFLNSAGSTPATISTNASGDLNLAAPSGTVSVGSGSGNILVTTTVATDNITVSSAGFLSLTGNASSTFNINGFTVDAGEFNRLDGKNAPLVDTNDAVATAITGVGTITVGVWNGTTIGVANGGTGATTLTSNGVLFGNGTGVIQATAAGTTGQCLVGTTGSAPSWGACLTAEADTLATVTGRGATTATASSFTGGATIRGVTVDSATGTNDKLALSITTVGAASFTGTLTNSDLTAARTYTLQDSSGVVALGTATNSLFFTTTGATNVTLPTSGTICSTVTCLTAEADTLAIVTGRGATTATASSFTGGATIRGLIVDTATATQDRILVTAAALGAARFDGTVTNADLTAARTYTLQDASGVVALGTATNSLFFTTTGATNVTLPTSGTLCSTTSCATAGAGYVQFAPASVQTDTTTNNSIFINKTGASGNILQLQNGGTDVFTINNSGNVTIGAGKSLTVTGSGTRPGSPTAGMLYYDTTTNQLLQWNGTKWVSDRSPATKIIAPSNASQTAKDSADVVLTGTADQTLINTALTAAAGGKVYIMEGTVTITGSLSVPNNTTLSGAGRGTLITIPNANNGTFNAITNTDTTTGTGVIVQEILLDGNQSNQTSGSRAGIYFSGMGAGTGTGARQGATIKNVWINNWHDEAIDLVSSANNTVSGNSILKNGYGVNLSTASNNTITGNTVQGNNSGINAYGISLSTSTYNNITGNLIITNGTYGINLVSSSTNNNITGNTVTGATSRGISLATSSNGNTIASNVLQNDLEGIYLSSSNGNTVTGNNAQSSGDSGIFMTGASNNSINGNTIQGSGGDGLSVLSSSNGNTITGNIILSSSGWSIDVLSSSYNNLSANTVQGGSTYGIALFSASNNVVIGNKIHDNGGAANNNGIILSSSNLNNITGNDITDSSATTTNYAINISNSGSNANYLANNTLGTGSINDLGTGTTFANQVDASGNLINKSQGGGFTVGAATATASLTLQGGLIATQLPAPTLSATVTNVGTAGATTYRYQITAVDGIGETTGSTIQQTTTGNATLSVTNYNTITWTDVPGAISYKIYRCTGAACVPALLTTVTGNNSSYNDQAAGAPSGAVPTTNTTGALQGASSLSLGTSSSVNGSLVVKNATNANTITLVSGATSASYSLTLPTSGPAVSQCLQTDSVTASLLIFGACGSGSGVTTVSAFSGSSQVNGASISGSTITFGPADVTNPGMVTASGSQTFGGNKTFNGSVTIAASQSLTITGSGTRPGSPTAGMLYYDTTTNQLLQWNGTKWISAPRTATKIIAPSNASQTVKDSADVVLTGTADQTLINTALTAAAGGTVYIMEGTVTVTGSISVPNNTTLAGAGRGTLITIPNAVNANLNLVTNTTTGGAGTGITVRDMQFDGNLANQTTGNYAAIYMNGVGSTTALTSVQGAKLTNLWIMNFEGSTYSNGSYGGGGINLNSSFNNTISNNSITVNANSGSTGIFLTGSSSNTFTNNIVQGPFTCVYMTTSANNTFTGNTFQNCADYGVNMFGTGANNTFAGNTFADVNYGISLVGTGTSSSHTVVTGNNFVDNNNFTDYFVYIYGDSNVTVTGNSLIYNGANAQYGIVLDTTSSSTVSGNTIEKTFIGVALWDSNSNIVQGNTITNNGSSTNNNAIDLSNADSNTITNNSITDTTHTTDNYAIDISSSTSASNYLSNNSLGGASINDLGSGTIYGGQVDSTGKYEIQPSNGTLIQASSTATTTLDVQTAQGASLLQVSTNTNGNLVSNPSLEVNTTGWTARTGTTLTRTTTVSNYYYGIAAAQAVNTATANAGINYPLVLTPNTSYVVSVMLKMSVTGSVSFGYSADGATEATYVNPNGYGNGGTGWYQVCVAFTTPATVNAGAYIFMKQNDSSARTMYMDGLRAATGTGNCAIGGGSSLYQDNQINLGPAGTPVLIGASASNTPTNLNAALFVQQNRSGEGLVVRATAENDFTGAVFDVQSSSGTSLLSVSNIVNGVFITGGSGFYQQAALNITTSASNAYGLRITGVASQTADLLQIRSSTGAKQFTVGASGDTNIGSGSIMPTITKSVRSTSSGTFAAKVDYTTPSSSFAITNADFNGDGKTDVATTSTVGATTTIMSVFMNNGNGTFATKVDYTGGVNGLGITSADFNRDSYPDIAVTNFASNTMSVFLNKGNGTFNAKVDSTTGTGPYGIASADFNGDGYPDLAVANQNSTTMSVFLNNGNGTFPATASSSGPTGTSPQNVTSADFNGDGKPDLAVTNNGAATTSIFINTGSGTFAAKVDYATGTNPAGISAADFNGDGKYDLAVANGFSSTVSVLINSGNGIFAAKVDYTTGTSPRGVTTGDFNGDGKMDMAVANNASTSISVFINSGLGSGQFGASPPTATSKTDYTTGAGSAPQMITNADFNGDGFADIASNTASTAMSIFKNTVSSGFSSSSTTQLSAKASVISDSGKVGLLVQGASTSDNIFQAQNSSGQLLSSIDGSGRLTVGGGQVYVAQLSVDGLISFATKVDYTTGTTPRRLAAADFNGDGKPDLAVTNSGSNTMSVLINSGTGTFAAKVDTATGTSPQGITSADFNGDGFPDLAVANSTNTSVSVYLNSGTGTFPSVSSTLTTGTSPQGITSADFNGDGFPDLVVTNATSNNISVFINSGTGTFAAKVDYTTATNPRSVVSADFNGDGYPDIAAANGSSTSMSVFINSGTGTFAAKVDYTTGGSPFNITAADFNGDGYPDIATVNNASGTMSVFINNDDGTFAAKVDYTTNSGPQNISPADVNNDGYIDLAVAAGTGTGFVSVFVNNGTGTFATKADFSTYASPVDLISADFNGDGKADFADTSGLATNVGVYINNSTSRVNPVSKGTLSVTTTDGSSGGLYIQGSVGQTADLLRIQNSSGSELFSVAADGLVTTKQLVIRSDHVGTVYESRTLVVDNAIGSTQNVIGLNVGGTERGTIRSDSAGALVVNSTGASALFLNFDSGTGGVIVGSSTTKNNLTINGTGTTCTLGAGAGATSCTSDGRLKNIVSLATGNLEKLMQIQPTYFTWKDPTRDQGVNLGLIAQDVQAQFPQFVITDINGNLALDYAALVTPLIGAVQEQQAEIEALGTSITTAELNVSGAATVASLTVTGDATVEGNLVVEGDVEVRNITVNGHIITAGNAPGVALGDAAGQAALNETVPVAVVDGNDSAGTVGVTTGSQNLTNGVLAHISFAEAFNGSYKVVLSASNDPAGLLRVHTVKTATGFDIVANDPVSALTQYTFDYIVLGAQTTQ